MTYDPDRDDAFLTTVVPGHAELDRGRGSRRARVVGPAPPPRRRRRPHRGVRRVPGAGSRARRTRRRSAASSPSRSSRAPPSRRAPSWPPIPRQHRTPGRRCGSSSVTSTDATCSFDQPGRGVAVVDVDAVELRPVDVPGRSVVHEVEVDLTAHPLAIGGGRGRPGPRAEPLPRSGRPPRRRSLGAAERAVDLAVEHAGNREQFGKPIGTFQAVRHLLAWAKTDCIALDSVIRKAVAPARRRHRSGTARS